MAKIETERGETISGSEAARRAAGAFEFLQGSGGMTTQQRGYLLIQAAQLRQLADELEAEEFLARNQWTSSPPSPSS